MFCFYCNTTLCSGTVEYVLVAGERVPFHRKKVKDCIDKYHKEGTDSYLTQGDSHEDHLHHLVALARRTC